MKRQKVVSAVLAACGLLVIGLAAAQAAPISPAIPSSSGVTISIFQLSGGSFVDITDSYLPTWTPTLSAANRTVYIVVNGSMSPPSLVVPPASASFPLAPSATNPYVTALTTSAYPGKCTNAGTDTDPDFLSPDFLFYPDPAAGSTVTISAAIGPNRTGYPLVSQDCGGMAVIQVGADKFVIPRDANLNGIPDFLESFGVALAPGGDNDGDGISNFDEVVRGFIVGGNQIRTNPTVKDAFLFLVKSQCGSPSFLGGGPITYPVASAGALNAYVVNMIPKPATVPPGISTTQVHFLAASASPNQSNEWVDQFSSYTIVSGTETWKFCDAANNPSCTPAITVTSSGSTLAPTNDRVININRVYGTTATPQRGIRVTECLDTSATSPWGYGFWGSPNNLDEAVIYTKRIVNFVNSKGKSTDNIYYSTFVFSTPTTGAWQTPPVLVGTGTAGRDVIISKAIQYIFAMEISHTVGLVPSLTTTFPHDATGTGSILDAQLRLVTTGSPTGLKYYIPSAFIGTELGGLTLAP